MQYRIEFLCDVRSVPISNHAPEFCGTELQQVLASHGITYVPMGDMLGGRPKDPTVYTDGYVDYDKLVERDSFRSGIARVVKGAAQKRTLAIFCSEGEPERCHRAKAVGVALQLCGVEVRHIDANGAVVSQDDVLARIAPQLPLLEGMPDPRKVSRGRYL
jgi:uncharacterized protein (DUF488 family)